MVDQGDSDGLDARTARARGRILATVRDVLTEEGPSAVTHQNVAKRAGVSRATLYRHWPDTAGLLIEALSTTDRVSPAPPTGDLRTDLVQELSALATELRGGTVPAALATIIERAEWQPDLRELKHDLADKGGERLAALLAAAAARGDLPASVDIPLVRAQLAGPLFYRRLITDEPLDTAVVTAVVDAVLRDLRAR